MLNPAFASVCFQNPLICRLPPRTLDLFLLQHWRSCRLCKRTQENTASSPRELCPVPGTRKPEDTGLEGKAFPVIVALRGPGFPSKPSAYLYFTLRRFLGVAACLCQKQKPTPEFQEFHSGGRARCPLSYFPKSALRRPSGKYLIRLGLES